MHAVFWLIETVLGIVKWIVIIQVVMSWLISFNVVNLYQPLVRQIWDGLERITEPMYRPIRRFLPNLGGLDLSPLIVLIIVYFLQVLIARDVAPALLYR